MLIALAVISALALMTLLAVLLALLRQHGRLLLRLDAIEATMVAVLGSDGLSNQTALAVGDVVALDLVDLDGTQVTGERFRGRRILAVNWDPLCSFCADIASDLSTLQHQLRENGIQLVLISASDTASNPRMAKEAGFDCPVLIRNGGVFNRLGTPVALLIDAQGRVERPPAAGAERVLALAREFTAPVRLRPFGKRPLDESRIERNGLKPGTIAPDFALPDLDGKLVSLGDYRGRELLLLFSDPRCQPCGQVLEFLATVTDDELSHLAVLIVSRGDAGENKRKVDESNIRFPVLLQDHWKLSRAYGIFLTPSAFLINRDGLIARTVAKGVDEIRELVRAELSRQSTRDVASHLGGDK